MYYLGMSTYLSRLPKGPALKRTKLEVAREILDQLEPDSDLYDAALAFIAEREAQEDKNR